MTDFNTKNRFNGASEVVEIRSNINKIIDGCKNKIKNTIGEDIAVNERINTVIKQLNIEEITYEEFSKNYLDSLLLIIQLQFFNNLELKFLMNFIIDELVKIELTKKESEK